MKKHLVILCGGYYPTPSPTGVCAEKYSSLFSNEYDIDVVCVSQKTDMTPFTFNKKTVYPVGSKYYIWQKGISSRSNKILLSASKIPVYIMGFIWNPKVLHWYAKMALKKLAEINESRKIDLIISYAAPMAAHTAAACFKLANPCVKWLAISFDSYGAQNHNKLRYCKYEKEILDKADHVFVSEEIFNSCTHLMIGNQERYSPLPYIIKLEERVATTTHVMLPKEKINLVYAGSFYKDLRSPDFLLRVAAAMTDKAVLHLFCTSDCDDLINHYVSIANGKIVRHNFVPQEEIKLIYQEADVLINVGNNIPQFKPSKTFEYMATLKPIINIFYDGFYDNTLAMYPKCLQVCNNSPIDDTIVLFDRFIEDAAGSIVDILEMKKLLDKHGEENIKSMLQNSI